MPKYFFRNKIKMKLKIIRTNCIFLLDEDGERASSNEAMNDRGDMKSLHLAYIQNIYYYVETKCDYKTYEMKLLY